MADYASLKVPELKKLLAERKLPQTGNKADLVARLQEEDSKPDGDSEAKPAKKRANRAKRFGIEQDDEDFKKRAERTARFGLEDKDVSGLDAALPERPLKRGRGQNQDGHRPGKRQSTDRRGNDRRNGRHGRQGGGGGGGGNAQARGSRTLLDPAEKAKAEQRAARFAAA
ncbi:Uncharacterized protein C31H12.03c [Beauveria bassiana]|uniref:Uncharacterized protein C31H12.03c n=1 Tax=Beauveria bassiana TaxID=176275 RepID=A0A2N6NKB0_BEABA|nr:Uncharacterized protein C31H12.03c [Beauveria bassiana]